MPLPKVLQLPLSHPSSLLTSALAQEELIKELTTQIARLTPMLKEGRGSTIHFLTREAADEEKRILEERLEKLRICSNRRMRSSRTRMLASRRWMNNVRGHNNNRGACWSPLTHRALCSGNNTSRPEGGDCPHPVIAEQELQISARASGICAAQPPWSRYPSK
jgi:hypothetical protein